ncbi:hypothetical protein [Burkholderia arboris]|uniref:hypothetical protein n=1 Tax=Burkholderia arboris TaxID=488730 RepID=UPI00158CDDD4|nr:hypothetical protein [Burkholderia arboris]
MRNDINSIANKNYRYKFSNSAAAGPRRSGRSLTRMLVKKSLLIICLRQRVDASFLSDSTMRPVLDGQPAPFVRHTGTRQMNRYHLLRRCAFDPAGYDTSSPACRLARRVPGESR